MTDLIKALATLPEEDVIQMVKSYCATKVANIITNNASLKSKIASLEEYKKAQLVQTLPEVNRKEMIEMFDSAVAASKEMSKLKMKF